MDRLSRGDISAAVHELGWRFLLGTIRTAIPVGSLTEAMSVAARVVAAAGPDADRTLWLDVRPDRLILTVQAPDVAWVTEREIALAGRISTAAGDLGRETGHDKGRETGGGGRSLQTLEIAIDALDIAAIRPFWKAVMGYADEAGGGGPEDSLVDPLAQGPAIWFQQMDAARPQRNRIHFDLCVPHDEAQHRLDAALAAGGQLRSDERAPRFWVLADAEGNEVCITTWQGRD